MHSRWTSKSHGDDFRSLLHEKKVVSWEIFIPWAQKHFFILQQEQKDILFGSELYQGIVKGLIVLFPTETEAILSVV